MKGYRSHYIKNLLLPCLAFSVTAGALSALLITVLKLASGFAIDASGIIYSYVRSQPLWLPLLMLGTAFLGLVAALILTFAPSCRGGGIPTAVAALRGITYFSWGKSVILLPISALITFLCGLPLGNEGPCVQMGTAIGEGTVRLLGGNKLRGWSRYIMTGGASAGFAMATGAPATSILFAMEEAHHRFSPLLFSVASISVITSQLVAKLLAHFGLGSVELFHISPPAALHPSLILIPLTVGLTCGICAVLFTRLYKVCDRLVHEKLKALPLTAKLPIIFACVALIGFFSADLLGSGHSLIDKLFLRHSIWYLIIIFFLVRAVLMMISNTAGVTGGIFLPTLAFGAMIGALCSEAFIVLGVIGAEHHILLVTVGMAAFLGASSKIPLTACVFAIEALCGFTNILSVLVGVTAAFLMVELSGLNDFSATVIKAKAESLHEGKKLHVIEAPLTVYKGSFVIDKEVRDILWPNSCVVLSVERGPNRTGKVGIAEGDILHVHYQTYDPIATAEELEALVGDQSTDIDNIMRPE